VERYHLRMTERAIRGRKKQLDLLETRIHMTLAMCNGDDPYLVEVNHAFDRSAMRLYFHCAPEGKKLDYLRSNPRVWGQVLEDDGYVEGRCDYSYRSVMFGGIASPVTSLSEKKHALTLMIDKMDADPAAMKKRLLNPERLKTVTVYRIEISEISGKQSVRK